MSATKLISVVMVLMLLQTSVAESPEPAEKAVAVQAGYVGEVTGNDVYVRSGPSKNYYPVTKLNAGARVRVVDEEGDWLAIVPPKGCFSLIADAYVDTGDDRHGVVSGSNVRVRAGSMMNDKMYAIQLKLSKGAEVEIVGHNDNGYYKIVPPPGAKLWIAEQYVARVPEELLTLEAESRTAPPGIEPGGAEPAPAVDGEESAELTASVTEVTLEQIQEYRHRVKELDAELKAELEKPLMRRDLDRIRGAFGPLADQTADEFSRVYAAARIEQITGMMEMIQAVKDVRKLREQVKATRSSALADRASIRPKPLPIGQGFDAEGELRRSAVYDSPAGPRRYRLVNPDKSPVRTIGYVELPRDSQINIEDFLGRRVGIRARQIKLETGNVDPISIYVAEEIVPLDTGGE